MQLCVIYVLSYGGVDKKFSSLKFLFCVGLLCTCNRSFVCVKIKSLIQGLGAILFLVLS